MTSSIGKLVPNNFPTLKHPQILLEQETNSILEYASKSSFRDYIMISLALDTGLRNSEIVKLTVFCIAPYSGITNDLDVPGTISKGGRPRSIPLHPDLKVLLTKWLAWKDSNNEPTLPHSTLFLSSRTKNPLSQRDFQRICSSISIKAIGRSIHPHILRHTFATRLLRKSNLSVVQNLLGHKNIQTTQIYVHPSREDFSNAIENM